MSKLVNALWSKGAAQFMARAKLLAAKVKVSATNHELKFELLSTSLSELSNDVVVLIVSFADRSRATVEDLETIGICAPNWLGLRDSFTFDEEYAGGLFALSAFKDFIVSKDAWPPFFKSLAKNNADLLMFFFSKTNRTEILRELYPKAVWGVALQPKDSSLNALGLLARMDLMTGSNYVPKLKEFVGDEFFERLTVSRQRHEKLPIHSTLDYGAGNNVLPSIDFLMTLLPKDKSGLRLSVFYEEFNAPLGFVDFTHATFEEELQTNARKIASEVLRRMGRGPDNVLWGL